MKITIAFDDDEYTFGETWCSDGSGFYSGYLICPQCGRYMWPSEEYGHENCEYKPSKQMRLLLDSIE